MSVSYLSDNVTGAMPEEIKALYMNDGIRKNLRIHFPNGERADIINDQLIFESFTFTESICSQNELQFGLCESNIVEFECVGVENIKGYTIEVYHEIDISSLPQDMVEHYGIITDDVPFPFFRTSYGVFIIDECPRQSDLQRRKVVAYSDFINDEEVTISPFEKLKWETKFEAAKTHTFNPILFALSNISQMVNFDVSDIGAFEDNSIKDGLTEAKLYPSLYNSYDRDRGFDIGVNLIVERLDLELLDFVDNPTILAYKIGDELTSNKEIVSKYAALIEPYKDRIVGYENNYEECVQILLKHCRPFAHIASYDREYDTYRSTYAYGMKNSGIFDPSFSNFSGPWYEFCFPYRITIEVDQMMDDVNIPTVIESITIDLFDKDSIDVYEPISGRTGNLFIPDLSETKNRIKTTSGEYVLDTNDYPNTMDIFRGLLEMNACFFKQGRDGLYSVFYLNDKVGLYPAVDLLPSAFLYPTNPNRVINSGMYEKNSIWYSDDTVEPYTAIAAYYIDSDGNLANTEYHKPVYENKYTELFSQTFINDGSGLVEIDLSSNNPFNSSMTVYGKITDLTITVAWLYNYDNPLHQLIVKNGIIEDVYLSWSDVTTLKIWFDDSNVEIGEEFRLSMGSVTQEEVEDTRQHHTYDLTDNYLISNYDFTEEKLKVAFEKILPHLAKVVYTPAEVKMRGMPWVEAGDMLEIYTRDSSVLTIALRRTLTGIQTLKDSMKSS